MVSHANTVHWMLWASLALFCSSVVTATLKPDECEVCIGYLNKFKATLSSEELTNSKMIETKFKDFCKTSRGKDNRFCYYLGGLVESATGILGEMSKPLSWSMPTEKVCEKLKKVDRQLCELRYDKQIDLTKVDLKKLKVRDLKKILNDWDEDCLDCLEKGDYIKRIELLKPQYVRTEL